MTTLTRAALKEIAKPRFEWVEIEGIGKVGIRSCGHLQLARRYASYQDQSGKVIPEEFEKSGVHQIIDQLMESETKPMFSDEDFDEIAQWDTYKLGKILDAIHDFNGEEEKKQ